VKILYIAEIVGKAGVYACKKALPELKKEKNPDFVIACADGATGGNGLGRNHAAYLRKLGIDVLTTGECCFFKKDLTENLGKLPYVLRPDNLNAEAPGLGSRIYRSGGQSNPGSPRIAVAVLLGQSGFARLHGNNPFSLLPPLLERLRQETPYVIVDFHAQATGEKQILFAMAAGSCSAVIGSHNRVQTADERIIKGTAVITDAGRTGSLDSVGGNDPASRIQEYLSGIPDWTHDAWARPCLQGVFIELDNGGKAVSVERICLPVAEAPQAEQAQKDSAAAAAEETPEEEDA
jgi:metallophosphoesterase (TIGR00282 family)